MSEELKPCPFCGGEVKCSIAGDWGCDSCCRYERDGMNIPWKLAQEAYCWKEINRLKAEVTLWKDNCAESIREFEETRNAAEVACSNSSDWKARFEAAVDLASQIGHVCHTPNCNCRDLFRKEIESRLKERSE